MDRDYLIKYLDKDKLEDGLQLLKQGVPVQYIVGNVNFYGNIIDVNNHVLIPRFETEELVEKSINKIKNKFNKNISILDLCTGSGCIAITLKKELNSKITASDISIAALEVAKNNALKNNTEIDFIESDIFSNINDKFDVIISNPPYISYEEEIDELVKNNEPSLALYATNDGLFFYEEILKNCLNYLNENFIICFEIGYKQGLKIKELANKYLSNVKIEIEKDLQGRDRFVFITK